jgi:hypothetical protein
MRRISSRLLPLGAAGLVAMAIAFQSPKATRAADHNDPIGVQAAYRSGDSVGGYDVATGDPTADIADLFAWYNGPTGNPTSVVLALTWRADPSEAKEKAFDPSVKYGIHIDTSDHDLLDIGLSGDGLTLGSRLNTKAEHDIIVWYGEHKREPGKWGMIVSGLPGVDHDVIGPVGKTLTPAPGVRVVTGLFDDPFFADLDGFFNSISVALGNDPAQNPSLPPDRFSPKDPRRNQYPLPFGYPEKRVDGFAKQNMHAVVVELPASAFPTKKLHVWGTTERKKGLAKSGKNIRCTFDSATEKYACSGGAQ